VHEDSLQFYADNKLNTTEDIKAQFAFDNASFEIKAVIDMRMHEETGELQLLIGWQGFTEEENSWEPVTSINADAPALVNCSMLETNHISMPLNWGRLCRGLRIPNGNKIHVRIYVSWKCVLVAR
jgi:hypothetical protein